MKKFYSLLFTIILLFTSNLAKAKPLACPSPGTYTIGPSGNFTSITQAIAALVSCGGSITGQYIFELQANYVSTGGVETFPITIPNLGTTASNTITFRPATGATNRIITSDSAKGTIILDSAQYVFFDGRSGGIGTAKDLTIENTNTSLFVASPAGASIAGTTITLTGNTTGLLAGMFVGVSPGAGYFPPGTYITSVISSTQFTVSASPAAALSSTTVITAGYNNSAIKFINDASNNTINYCYVKSRNKSATSGTVFFSNNRNSAGTGNDNNTIDNCDIGGDATNTPLCTVYSDGSPTSIPTTFNSGNTITNNSIHDFYSSTASPSGVLLRNSTNWTISGNSIYQTASRNFPTNNLQFNGINITNINTQTTSTFQVNDNYLGGTGPNCNVTAGLLTITGSGYFLGISLYGGIITPSSIARNKIAGIDYTTDGSGANFRLITVFSGSADITNNIIGSQTISNSIRIALNTSNNIASLIAPNQATAGGIINVSNNTIGGITFSTAAASPPTLRAISSSANPTSYTINNNLINGISTPSNVTIRAIWSNSHSATNIITNNRISNITQTSASANGELVGIYINSLNNIPATNTSNYTISNNTINNLSTTSSITGSLFAVAGIELWSSGTTNIIDQDTIYALQSTNSATSLTKAIGIYVSGSAGGNVRKNSISGFTNLATNGNLIGYMPAGGNWDASNNMISLSNSTHTNSCSIYGISDASGTAGTRNYYYNSIYIGGNGAGDNATIASAALLNNCAATGYSTNIKNNILMMNRKGATGHFYSIANNTSNSSNYTSNNNILNCIDTSSVVLWGGSYGGINNKSFYYWQKVSPLLPDLNSYTGEYLPFTDTATANLHINIADTTLAKAAYVSNVESRGSTIAGISVDFDNDSRPGPAIVTRGGALGPDIGADEVDLVYSGDDIWNGGFSSNWTDAANWNAGVPTSVKNAIIPASIGFYPVITSGVVSAKNIVIGLNASIIDSSTLQIAGTIANSGAFNAEAGTIELNGSVSQSISGSIFTNRTIRDLKITNSSGVNISSLVNDTLNITGSIGFGNVNNAVLNTGDNITLRSTANATARVSDVTNGGANSGDTIIGKVIIERYLPMQNSSISRRWRLLTSPIKATGAPTMNASWQEGASNSNVNFPINPRLGYGTQITNGNTAAAVVNGFDIGSTASPSIYYMSPGLSPAWIVPSSTNVNPITDHEGYMIFSRGDRSVIISNQFVSASPTNLAVKGNLNIGDVTKTLVTGKQVIGNPYASAIKFDKITLNGATPYDSGYSFYYWDPKTSGSYNVGRFITVSNSGYGLNNYTVTANSSGIYNGRIESGAAFVVISSGAPNSITFHEKDKIDSNSTTGIASRPVNNPGLSSLSKLYTNLYFVDQTGTQIVADGVANTFYPAYNNAVDGGDAPELISFNSKENLSIIRDGNLLSIEKRKTIAGADTTYLEMRNMDNRNYRLEFVAENFTPGVQVYLEDKYTAQIKEMDLGISGSAFYDFSVDNSVAASADMDRFKIVLKPIEVLPVTFSKIKANREDDIIAVEWKMENAINIEQYEIERSSDGIHFTKIGEVAESNVGEYSYIDQQPSAGSDYIYYRIKTLSNTGQVLYSEIVKVDMNSQNKDLLVYPTTIQNGVINIQFTNQAKGQYIVSLTNIAGQLLMKKSITYSGGITTESVSFNKSIPVGKYHIEILQPDNKRSVFPVLIQH